MAAPSQAGRSLKLEGHNKRKMLKQVQHDTKRGLQVGQSLIGYSIRSLPVRSGGLTG
jgi:hypothetical protein